jgi:integrase
MKFRQKPNGIWVVDYEDDQGKRRRVSTGIKTPPQRNPPADVRIAGREVVLGVRGAAVSPSTPKARSRAGRFTMSDLFDKCQLTVWHPDNVRSQRTITSNVKVLNGLIGDVPVEDMTYTRLDQLVTDMKTRGYKPATIKRKLAMVGKALKMATMWTDETGAPLLRAKPAMPTVVVNNLKDRIIEPREEEAMWAAVEKRRQLEPNRQWFKFRVLLGLLFDTAGRLGETINLGPKSLTQEGGMTFVTFPRYRTKSGKPRKLPLAHRSVEGLGSLMDHLTLDRATGEWRFFGFAENLAGVMFRQIKEDVERETGMDLSDVTLHTIRHTTLTRLARGGMDLARLQLWAGHSDPKITSERYLHFIPSDLVGGLDILNTGTPGANRFATRTKPATVSVPKPAAIRANPGTVSLQ